jgi:hypothetical protein
MVPDRRVALALVLAAALAGAAACSSPTGPTTGPDSVRVDPIQIDTVDVLIQQTTPPQASAHVTGVLGDGCTTLRSVTQVRLRNAVTLTILRERPVDAVCSQLAKLYDATLPLEGSYTAGRYTLTVNGLKVPFQTN